jgi:hypothetical protein
MRWMWLCNLRGNSSGRFDYLDLGPRNNLPGRVCIR